MTADEVLWTPYKTQEIWAYWVSTWHGFIAYFDCVEPYMPDKALWLEAPSHLLTESWTSVPVILPSSCTDDYMEWFLSRSHPRIQNPANIPHGFHVPIASTMPAQALLDLIARESTREDVDERERLHMVVDLLRRHYRTP
ncbi:hypothetical protein M9H77_02221 [Catharanthus roseus]|uniref:Uncharacterized protein n=1 Tax=Catharanthus roseus TaxID=4058 RepID=A0ACC0C7X2_CATRO|nr:hypothetical protein M9H77_02221 [Catharanthus roseus]